MSHDKFFGICENKCLVEINADSVGAAAQDLSNIDNAVFAEKATAAGVGGGGIGSEVVPIENGGTGATTAEEARTNLSVASADHTHTLEEITGSSVLSIENGGTGATTAEEARTNLNVAVADHTHTLEEITGSSVLAIENGGTGATTAEEARTNLGVASSDLSNVDSTVFLEKATNAGVGGGSGTVLFSSESGTTDTTITLSDDISNYKYVEVYYQTSSGTYTVTNEDPDVFDIMLYGTQGPIPFEEEGTKELPNAVGVEKAIVGKDGTTHIRMVRSKLSYSHTITFVTNYENRRNRRRSLSETITTSTASLVGNILTHNAIYSNQIVNKSENYTYTQANHSGVLHYDLTDSSSSTNTSGYINYSTSTSCIYAIVGYK